MYVICTNDSPFCLVDMTEQKADEFCKKLQAGFDNRKECYSARKVHVYARNVPMVKDISQIAFPIWDSEWPRIKEEL